MKNKFLLVALIAILLGVGVVLASCGSRCVGDGKCVWDPNNLDWKWCGDSVTSFSDIEKALDCGAATSIGVTSKKTCDC